MAPNAKWRSQVVPRGSEPVDQQADHAGEEEDSEKKSGAGRYIPWSRLLRRVFNLDMECCPNCGGQVKVIAAIEEPAVIGKILTHLGLSPRPPPKSSARYNPYDEAGIYSSTY